MESMIKFCLLLLLALGSRCSANRFRSDYERNDQAGGWFKYYSAPASWANARQACHADGATLVSPLSKKLSSAVASFLLKISRGTSENYQQDYTIFIGVHATFSEGDYSSIEGVPLRQLEITWAPEEPDNRNNSERCLAMTVNSYSQTVADMSCDRMLPYICYKKDTEKNFRSDYEWSERAAGWLKYHVIPSTWEKAKPRCQAEGAVLASPLTSQLEAAIVAFVQGQEVVNEEGVTIFTGVRKTSEQSFTSIEGKPLQQMSVNWLPGEPHNTDSESCIAMRIGYTGAMADTRCDSPLPYVCYKPDTTVTVSTCGADPEYQFKSETGSCYKLHKKGLSWSEAYMTCMAEGGYLAIINNQVEANVVKDIINKFPKEDMDARQKGLTFLGFLNWNKNGKEFRTISGESLNMNYNTWMSGEPNNGNNSNPAPTEDCGTIERNTMGLNDYECNVPTAFLCEKDPKSLSNN